MISLGVDVGTTTTHHALWRMEPLGSDWGPARLLAESPVRETPWNDGDLDVETLVRWHRETLAESIALCGTPDLGAALLTGEAARSDAAPRVLEKLGELCGGLVGSLAGGRIESLLAGRASGAERDAAKRLRHSACLDIGGGTANAAIFRPDGSHALSNLRIGGRMVRMDPAGEVLSSTSVADRMASELGIPLERGRRMSPRERKALCARAADICLGALDGSAPDWAWDVPWDERPGGWEVLHLCGGVGECARTPPADPLRWGDLGPDLARAFLERVPSDRLRFPNGSAIRTTVTGVASRLVRLSGSTIWDGRGGIPVRDMPVMELDLRQFPSQRPRVPDGHPGTRDAWSIRLPESLDWKRMRSIAEHIAELSSLDPLVALVRSDHARALGQALRLEAPGRKALVLDRLEAREGDFLDVGPALDNGSVAVSLRTLNWPTRT